jgi:hypothetical protein
MEGQSEWPWSGITVSKCEITGLEFVWNGRSCCPNKTLADAVEEKLNG